jgi:hypothetical protein
VEANTKVAVDDRLVSFSDMALTETNFFKDANSAVPGRKLSASGAPKVKEVKCVRAVRRPPRRRGV